MATGAMLAAILRDAASRLLRMREVHPASPRRFNRAAWN
jgi:hypothetical protein